MQLCYHVRYVNGLLAQQLCAVLCQSTFWAFADKALLIGGAWLAAWLAIMVSVLISRLVWVSACILTLGLIHS